MPLDTALAVSAPVVLFWKDLPLPDGTRVWMRCHGSEFEAVVDGGVIMWGDRAVSPTEFANSVAGHPRNAWRDLWLLRPGLDVDFRLADDLRAELGGVVRPPRRRPGARVAAAPRVAVKSLVPFLIAAGGLRDDRGDVLALLGGSVRTRPGLISSRGRPLDEAALLALENGYFPEHAVALGGAEGESLAAAIRVAGADCETITPADLLDAIDAELRGTLRFPDSFAPAPVADPGRDEYDRSVAEAADAAAWRGLVAAAASGGAAAVAEFLAAAGVSLAGSAPAAAPAEFVAFDDYSAPF